MPAPYASLGTDAHPQILSRNRNAPSNRFPREQRFSDRADRIGLGPAGEGIRAPASLGRQSLSTHISEPRARIGTSTRPQTAVPCGGHDALLVAPPASIGPGPASVPVSRYRPATAGNTTAAGSRGNGKNLHAQRKSEVQGKVADDGCGARKVVRRRPRTSSGRSVGGRQGDVRGGYTTWSGCRTTAPSPSLSSRHRFGDFTRQANSDMVPGPGAYSVPSLFGGTQASSRCRSAPSYSAGGGTDVRPCNRTRVRRADLLRTRGGEGYVYDAGYHDARVVDTRCTYDVPSLMGRKTLSESTKSSAPMFSIRGREKFGTPKGGMDIKPRQTGPPKVECLDPKVVERIARRQRIAEQKAAQRVHGAFLDKLLVPRGCSTSNSAASGFERAFFHGAHASDVFLFNQPRRFEGVG